MGKRKHNLVKHPLYWRWKCMRQRCSNVNHPNYNRYGGRGITVCKEWNDFKSFYDWAINNGYSHNLDLDRINNDKGYEPGNCRFTSTIINCNNQERNVKFYFNGKVMSLSEISRATAIKNTTLHARLNIQKLTIMEAVLK